MVFTRDAEEFAASASDFLAERLERNVLATMLVHALCGRFAEEGPLFAYSLDTAGRVHQAALRAAPWPLLCSDSGAGAADELMTAWLLHDPDVPGVSAPSATARALANCWRRLTHGSAHCRLREAIHELTEVTGPSRPAMGRLRPASGAERELLIDWEHAFTTEAHILAADPERSVVWRLAHDAQFVWDDGGPVSTLTVSPAVNGTVRIGPVYTPPEQRRRGYASAAVACICSTVLAQGADRCMLFTDVTNQTSNKIYAAIGFRRIADWEEHSFSRPGKPENPSV